MPESMMQPDLSAVPANGGVRGAALARWQETGWPGPRAEAWRYTSLARLSDVNLAPATGLAGGLTGPGAAATSRQWRGLPIWHPLAIRSATFPLL